jgi:peptide/nickel transport system permease protein
VTKKADFQQSRTDDPAWWQGPRDFVKRLFTSSASAFGSIIFLIFVLMALVGPAVVPYQANQQIYEDVSQAPSSDHIFGTDHLGRDVFSRVVLGARDIFTLAGLGTLVAVLIGTFLGLISGYFGGWFDEVLMRFFDSLLSIPALLFALLMLGTIGPSRLGVLMVLMIVYPPIVARVVRSVVLSEKNKSYIGAARTQGESTLFILIRLILPAVYPALAVEASLRFSYAIFLTASLGFLGVGVQPPNPDWGLMVNEARRTYTLVPWALYFPAGVISLIVIGINLMSDGLQRALRVERNYEK